ncbi:hypothetical protein [Stenotrophomonas acidaminiphila]|uniref:hypothetical protein n=1 Tax=Stenotrophomonas acidaminiphila TaxID=128780 RepID=UPI0020C5C912|nr:hypothetical protein [Stenotrophomonas acidaminiphila]
MDLPHLLLTRSGQPDFVVTDDTHGRRSMAYTLARFPRGSLCRVFSDGRRQALLRAPEDIEPCPLTLEQAKAVEAERLEAIRSHGTRPKHGPLTDAEAKAWQRFMDGEEARRRAEVTAMAWRVSLVLGAIALAAAAWMMI